MLATLKLDGFKVGIDQEWDRASVGLKQRCKLIKIHW